MGATQKDIELEKKCDEFGIKLSISDFRCNRSTDLEKYSIKKGEEFGYSGLTYGEVSMFLNGIRYGRNYNA